MIKNKVILTFFLLFTGYPAYADNLTLSLGTSVNYLKINDPNYHYKSEPKLNNINIGLNYIAKPFVISATSNRFLLQETSQQIISKKNGVSFENRTRTTADILSVGYQVGRFIPSVFISNAQVYKSLYHNDTFLGKTKQSSFIYGLNVNYFYDNNLSFSTAILAPNKELGLETGIVLGINYNFNIL